MSKKQQKRCATWRQQIESMRRRLPSAGDEETIALRRKIGMLKLKIAGAEARDAA